MRKNLRKGKDLRGQQFAGVPDWQQACCACTLRQILLKQSQLQIGLDVFRTFWTHLFLSLSAFLLTFENYLMI